MKTDYAVLAELSKGLSGGDILTLCLNAIYMGSTDPNPERWVVTQAMIEAEITKARKAKAEHSGEKAGPKRCPIQERDGALRPTLQKPIDRTCTNTRNTVKFPHFALIIKWTNAYLNENILRSMNKKFKETITLIGFAVIFFALCVITLMNISQSRYHFMACVAVYFGICFVFWFMSRDEHRSRMFGVFLRGVSAIVGILFLCWIALMALVGISKTFGL